jgi:hypothetical protein
MTQQCRRFSFWPTLPGIFLIALMAMGFSGRAFGQGDPTTVSLRGLITDPSGARINKATIVLSSSEKGIARTTQSDKEGGYSFGLLPPSTYTLTVEMKGFKGYKQIGITLDAGQSANQDVALTLGSQLEQVTVTAEAPLLQKTDSNISADIDEKQVVELPLNLRNIIGLTTLNSSVNNTTLSQSLFGGSTSVNGNADQDISFLAFAGGFFGTSAYLLDGVWDTSGDWGASIYVPSVDAVQEFKIQNNSFTAQYGWSTGNVVDIVTKSGTSKFHGSAYEFYRNSAMDANLWFANHNKQPKPDFDRNQYGVSAGGPLYLPGVYKQTEKTFVFGLYERLLSATPSLSTDTVPIPAFYKGDFSALLGSQEGVDGLGRPIYSGQIYDPNSARQITTGVTDPKTGLAATQTGYIRDPIPGNNVAAYLPTFNALAVKMLSYYPTATNPTALTNNYTASASAPAASREYLIRVDHNIDDNTRIFSRYSYKQEYKTGTPETWGSDPAGPGNMRPNNRYNLTAGFSHVFGPTFTMNSTAGFEHWGETSTNQSLGFKPSTLGLPNYLDSFSAEFPYINVGGETTLGPRGGGENDALRPTGSAAVDFFKTHNTHALSFGFMGVGSEQNYTGVYQSSINFGGGFTNGPNPDSASPNTGFGMAQALFGVVDGGSTGQQFNPAIIKKYAGVYLQDDWRFTHKLTLNLGLRYEIQNAPTYRHNTGAFFDPQAANPIGITMNQPLQGALIFTSPDHRGTYDTNYKNIAPRLGFSYNPVNKLVFRGGFGIFFPPSAFLNQTSTDGFSTSTNVIGELSGQRVPNPSVSISNPWYQGLRSISGNSLGEMEDVGYGTGAYFRSRHSSYIEQYMAGLQYAFRDSDVLDITYVGLTGKHQLTGGFNESQLDPKYLSLGTTALNNAVTNPYFGYIAPGQSGCGMDGATISQSHLLEPYTQYCGVTQNDAPIGFSNYNALEVNFKHRFSQGLNVLASYTFSKFLDNVEGTDSWSYSSNQGPANNYNMAAEKSVDSGDIPQSLVINYIYDLPVGRGKTIGAGLNRATDAILGGWEVSGISTFKQGIPLGFSGNNINSYGGNPRPNVNGSPKASSPSIKEWFNTAAFSYAPYGTFGTAPRNFSNLRGPNYQNWDLAIMKNWSLPKATRLQFRAEMFNAFNHPNFYTPNTNYGGCDPNASSNCNSSFGSITQTFFARDVQMAAKFYW